MELENFEKEKLTVDIVKANIYGIFSIIPIAIVYGAPFYFAWNEKFTTDNFKNSLDNVSLFGNGITASLTVIGILIAGIVVHELIHGLVWSLFAKNGLKSIKFGVLIKLLTPYCHCKEPLKVKHYILGAIMPAIVLGFLPAVFAIILGNIPLLLFAVFFTMAAIGDAMIINLIRKENKNSLVLDHPTEAGCYIFREK